ncbi:syntaxin-18 [Drosophila guanche]|uniref:Syntaxin-18 n=1 Tax=Drosophila guanche TaxID=7266 RepID=A0A3B0KE39_DROGU|nr:syntaxin-18 [Drosophila guanche]SPP84549.1 blast:Syntaxin-18 [Drosophila guanche]
MDITQHFKASVMTVRLQRKTELASSGRGKATARAAVAGPSKATGPRDDFAIEAKKVCNKITDLRNLLIENRTAYMKIGQHLKSAAHMTDAQRNLIDRESEKFVAVYTQLLAKMRSEWKSVKRKPQERQHIEAVLDLLVSYLHSVEQIYLDQKKYRVQHELETYRLLKLAADKKKIPVRPGGGQSAKIGKRLLSNGSSPQSGKASPSDDGALQDSADNDWSNDGWAEWDDDEDEDVTETDAQLESSAPQSERHKARTRKRSKGKPAAPNDSSAKVAVDEDINKSAQELVDDEDPLSAEDVQLFEAENVHMYNFLQGLSEEVEQIGKNVVDIAQLQDIFTEKVAMQQHNIERIASAVVGSTENVKDANEQIRQATQRNASVRVYFLFFLIVMSFSLLFLDWYYD